ncbi:MAG: hypothetical protein J2P21_28015 [Chloracidobacterium sp.]|nr:hypothetical protein [Chloracidobacterium sp.]
MVHNMDVDGKTSDYIEMTPLERYSYIVARITKAGLDGASAEELMPLFKESLSIAMGAIAELEVEQVKLSKHVRLMDVTRHQVIVAAVLAEREECAKIADKVADEADLAYSYPKMASMAIAEQIRARSSSYS